MKKNRCFIVFIVMAVLMCSVMTVGATGLIDSTPSNHEDLTVGEDMSQNKKTSYGNEVFDETTFNKTYTSMVYATKSSEITIKYPVDLSLDGSNGKASYVVGAKADISGNQKLSIVPEESFEMKEVGVGNDLKQDIIAVVNQEVKELTQSQLKRDEFVYVTGEIQAPLSAGIWQGPFEINVFLENLGE